MCAGGARGRPGAAHGRRAADERGGEHRHTGAGVSRATFDSLWLDLTKGLGAPVGAVLAGSRAFIEEAWVFKQRFGGAMRQAGIIAAAGIYALEHHVERLAEDHERARRLAAGLAELPGIAVDAERVETNIVIFDVRGTGLSGEAVRRRARWRRTACDSASSAPPRCGRSLISTCRPAASSGHSTPLAPRPAPSPGDDHAPSRTARAARRRRLSIRSRGRRQEPPATDLLGSGTWVDLTHDFSERDHLLAYLHARSRSRSYRPSAPRPGSTTPRTTISASEHGGTHLDAPIHFAEGKHTTDQVPLDQLDRPGRRGGCDLGGECQTRTTGSTCRPRAPGNRPTAAFPTAPSC